MPTDEETAAGAAGAGGAGESVKPVTTADIEAMLAKHLPTVVNSAVASQLKRARADIEKQIAALRPQPKSDEEQAAETAEVQRNAGQVGRSGNQGAQSGADASTMRLDDHPAFLELKKQAEAQKKELERINAQRKEEQKRAAETATKERKTRLASTVDTLLGKTVAPGRAAHARAFLTHPDNNRITYEDDDDSDNLVFIDDNGDKVPLEKGLKTWLKSDDAKHFLPPINPGGSGGGPGNGLGFGADPKDPRNRLTDAVHRLLNGE